VDHAASGYDDRTVALLMALLQAVETMRTPDFPNISIPVMWAPSGARPEDAGLRHIQPAPVLDSWYR
jgi:hypothetical protein